MTVQVDPIRVHARSHPDKCALHELESGRTWTYAALDRAVDRLAHWLVERLEPNSGERVAALSRNRAEMVCLHLACVRAGAIFVPLNWRLAASEIAGLCEDAKPALMFAEAEFSAVGGVGARYPIEAVPDLGRDGLSAPASARRPFCDVGTLLYTSGTSGRPKGVMVSEEGAFWGCTNFNVGNDLVRTSVALCDMPLFHLAGLYTMVRAPLQAGATVLLSRQFEPGRTLAVMASPTFGVTHYFSVPQMAATLWNHADFDAHRLRTLASWTIGGAPNPKAQSERFVSAGIPVSEGFGMSETGSNFAMLPHDGYTALLKAGSCGVPLLSVEARIVDEDGNDLPNGTCGELLIRGPSVCKGYWNQPELTAKAFIDGWFRTGDAALKDGDGYYFIVDRKKDMFISGGENVYPAEIEAVLAEIPEIAECAVVAVPDARWGEVGRVYVIPVAGKDVSAKQILSFCTERLAKYKVPQTAVIADAIPRTASGKVQKNLLRKQALRELKLHED